MTALIDEATFVPAGKGRVRCVETGHEMPVAQKESYASSKACRAALFDLALSKKRPPLNYFEQSTTDKDRMVCKLTGAIVNKKEAAVWKHVLGKKFNNKLTNTETKDDSGSKNMESSLIEDDQPKSSKKKKDEPKVEQVDDEDDDEKPEFWVPPANATVVSMKRGLKEEEKNEDEDDVMDELEAEIEAEAEVERVKRTALAVGPSGSASKKKKVKFC